MRTAPAPRTAGGAGSYLLLFALTFAFFAVDMLLVEHLDASMAGVLLYLVTVPLSLVEILAVPAGTGPTSTAVILGIPAVCAPARAAGRWLALRSRPVPVR